MTWPDDVPPEDPDLERVKVDCSTCDGSGGGPSPFSCQDCGGRGYHIKEVLE